MGAGGSVDSRSLWWLPTPPGGRHLSVTVLPMYHNVAVVLFKVDLQFFVPRPRKLRSVDTKGEVGVSLTRERRKLSAFLWRGDQKKGCHLYS